MTKLYIPETIEMIAKDVENWRFMMYNQVGKMERTIIAGYGTLSVRIRLVW